MKISLTRGMFAIIDMEDYKKVKDYKWFADVHKNGRVYAATNIKTEKGRRILRMHQLILDAFGKDIDHRDRNGLNNRKSNLRVCSRGQNLAGKIPKGESSRYKGVSFDRNRIKWIVALQKDKTIIHVGRFDSEVDAALAYNKKAKELHGEFAFTNKVLKSKKGVIKNGTKRCSSLV